MGVVLMVAHCSQCGKDFEILYPDLWRYKTWNKTFCSWHCLRADERKEDNEMARLKKDGTPAKKPGPRKSIAEAEQEVAALMLQGGVNYQLMVDEARTPEVDPEFELEVTAVRHKNYGEFYRDHDHNCIDWRTPGGDEMSLSVDAWKKLTRDLAWIIRQLGVEV
jgi:hypothetical protein